MMTFLCKIYAKLLKKHHFLNFCPKYTVYQQYGLPDFTLHSNVRKRSKKKDMQQPGGKVRENEGPGIQKGEDMRGGLRRKK